MIDVDREFKGILQETLGVDEDELTKDSTLADDLGADELDIVEIAMQCEAVFKIDIPDDTIDRQFRTVGEAIAYLEKRVNPA